jgi:hypothetical protein
LTFASALLITVIAGGTLATYLFEDDAPLGWRVCAGASAGMAAFGLLGLLFSAILGLAPLTLVLSGVAVGAPLALLMKPRCRNAAKQDLAVAARGAMSVLACPSVRNAARILLLALIAAVIWTINDRVVFERAGGLFTGVTNNLGDLPFHLATITRFLYDGNLPPENPIYAGDAFTYPFLADFVTAMFAAAGADLPSSLVIFNLVLMCALIGVIYRWAFELTSDRGAAVLVPGLMLLNGGLGWWVLVKETQETGNSILSVLSRLPHDYTIMDGNWRWGNMVTALLLPQRAFLFGLPLALLVFTLWRAAFDRGQAAKAQNGGVSATRRMVAAGVITGLLPLVHMHSYAVVMAIGSCFALASDRPRTWIPFFAMSLAFGVPQILWFASGSSVETARFVGWHLGWDHGQTNILWFWLKNTGVLIPLILGAVFWRGRRAPVPAQLVRLYLPFTALFVVPNILRLSPWIWDNIKLLIYWHVASTPLVALVLVHLWRRGRLYRPVAAGLVVLLTCAGALDVWRVISRASEHDVVTREGMAFADVVQRAVPSHSLILHAPTYNHPVFLSGRRSLMGYPGHLWSHGIPYQQREADIRQIYSGDVDAALLIKRYGIDYIVLGPHERELLQVNEPFFTRFPTAGMSGSYALFRVPSRAD